MSSSHHATRFGYRLFQGEVIVGDAAGPAGFPQHFQSFERRTPIRPSQANSRALCPAFALNLSARMGYIDLEFFSKEVGEGSIGEIENKAVSHDEHLVEDRKFHYTVTNLQGPSHNCLRPRPLSQSSTCPKACCCH